MDRTELAQFLRSRREALRPADVGMVAGARRRTPGLRREEVAVLADISTDYYERLEQARGPRPSESLLDSLARALRLSADERDHLYVVAGHQPRPAYHRSGYVEPGLMHLLDSLATTPALVTDDLNHVLAQNPLCVALIGDFTGLGRESNAVWRWFTDPRARALYLPAEHEAIGQGYVADLRAAVFRRGNDETARQLAADLRATSKTFHRMWDKHDVATMRSTRKTLQHPAVGLLEVQCDIVLSPTTGQRLILFRPQPGTDAAERMDLLRVIGSQTFAP
jgi:transcriptional regulator with XRE-family HTH domain